MILVRDVFQAKYGKGDELVAQPLIELPYFSFHAASESR